MTSKFLRFMPEDGETILLEAHVSAECSHTDDKRQKSGFLVFLVIATAFLVWRGGWFAFETLRRTGEMDWAIFGAFWPMVMLLPLMYYAYLKNGRRGAKPDHARLVITNLRIVAISEGNVLLDEMRLTDAKAAYVGDWGTKKDTLIVSRKDFSWTKRNLHFPYLEAPQHVASFIGRLLHGEDRPEIVKT